MASCLEDWRLSFVSADPLFTSKATDTSYEAWEYYSAPLRRHVKDSFGLVQLKACHNIKALATPDLPVNAA